MRSIGLALLVLFGCDQAPNDRRGNGGASTSQATSSAGAGGVATPCAGAETHEGEATYYKFADGSGNCSFPATPDLMVAAMNGADYAGSAVCGSCVRIEGPDGSVDVRIVDRCPGCAAGDLDLSPEAFEQIAQLSAGRVPIHWQYVACPHSGPVAYHFKEGSNPWWTAVQVRNHRHAIARFEYRNPETQAWLEVERLDYNYFVAVDGMGEGPFSFRITDVLGQSLEDEQIPLLDDDTAQGAAQFPPCE